METFSALLALFAGNSPVSGKFPAQRPVTRSFDAFFDLRLIKQQSKHSRCWWFERLSRPLWCHCNVFPDSRIDARNSTHWGRDERIFVNENVRISIKISLKFVPKGPINNIPALVQIMAWRRPSDKPLSEPMMVRLPTHICVTRPQRVNSLRPSDAYMRQ